MTKRWTLAVGAALALALLTLPAACSFIIEPFGFFGGDAEPCDADAKPAPLDYTLRDMNGEDVDLAQFKARSFFSTSGRPGAVPAILRFLVSSSFKIPIAIRGSSCWVSRSTTQSTRSNHSRKSSRSTIRCWLAWDKTISRSLGASLGSSDDLLDRPRRHVVQDAHGDWHKGRVRGRSQVTALTSPAHPFVVFSITRRIVWSPAVV